MKLVVQFFRIYSFTFSIATTYCYWQPLRTVRCIQTAAITKSLQRHSSPTQVRLSSITDPYVSEPLESLLKSVQTREPIRLPTTRTFKNRYIGLRHGQSEANVLGIISSSPDVGTTSHGLTELGVQQAKSAAADLDRYLSGVALPHSSLLFISSDFKRARETAQVCREELLSAHPAAAQWDGEILIQTELRERFFGDFDAKDLLFYNKVWPVDTLDADNNRNGVESINQVIRRLDSLLSALESSYSDRSIVLVSHADTLQILQTYICSSGHPNPACDSRLFHTYRFKNGEVRDLTQLPEPVSIVYK